MITGSIKNQVDRVWDAFWAGGVSNPLSVIEQFTYLLFARRIDDLFTAEEARANMLKEPIKNPLFGKNQQHLRWSRLKNLGDPQEMFRTFRDEIFPFIKELNRDGDSAFFSVPEEEIKRIESVLTVVDGKIVYGADDFGQLAPSPIPVLPEWSPVKEYGGYYRLPQASAGQPHVCSRPNGLHALLHRVLGQHEPNCEEPLWGLGCECFAF